ncbi:fatty acid desaturase, partial [Pseudomonas sp. FW305-130]
MNTSLSLQRDAAVPADIAPRVRLSTIADDKAMLRTAAELTRDLN